MMVTPALSPGLRYSNSPDSVGMVMPLSRSYIDLAILVAFETPEKLEQCFAVSFLGKRRHTMVQLSYLDLRALLSTGCRRHDASFSRG